MPEINMDVDLYGETVPARVTFQTDGGHIEVIKCVATADIVDFLNDHQLDRIALDIGNNF